MNPDPENLIASLVSKDGLIVSVEPSDLKNVWKIGEELRESDTEIPATVLRQLPAHVVQACETRAFIVQ